MEAREPTERTRVKRLVVIVVVLVLIGLVAATWGSETNWLMRFAPILVALFAVYVLVASRFQNVVGPLVIIVLALAVQLVTLEIVTGEDLLTWWPFLLLLVALAVFMGYLRPAQWDASTPRITGFTLLGGTVERVTGERFAGGSVTTLLGRTTLDLRAVDSIDEPATLNVINVLGAVDLVVPERWSVRIDVSTLAGAVRDARSRGEPSSGHAEPDIVVTGIVAFGGLTVSTGETRLEPGAEEETTA